MIDASVAEKCREHPELASDLQTLCWASFGIGAIISSASSGFIYDKFSSLGLFFSTIITSLLLCPPSIFNWLSEKSTKERGYVEIQSESLPDGAAEVKSLQEENHESRSLVIKLSVYFLAMSFGLGILAEANIPTKVLVAIAIIVALTLTTLVFKYLTPISPTLARFTAFIFVYQSIQPSSVIISYWLRDVYPHCQTEVPDLAISPCFSAHFLTNLGVVGNICFLLGTVLYNMSFSSLSYRRIYFVSQTLLLLTGMLDLILVSRTNLSFGIPDEVFLLGDEIISDLLSRLNVMPLFVLAASLCPEGIEATLFALIMGLSNFGNIIGSYLGLGLLDLLNVSRENNFHNLLLYVEIRTLCKILPLFLIPFWVPSQAELKVTVAEKD